MTVRLTPKSLCLLSLLSFIPIGEAENPGPQDLPEFSIAGDMMDKNSPRQIYNLNVGWRFFKGDFLQGQAPELNDTQWERVNVPHGLELVPEETSGCSNYQGPVWYRKHFTPPTTLQGQKLTLYFEAMMGKAEIYLNGRHIASHKGGFLPISLDATPHLILGEENTIAIKLDNSDDPTYPPGKPQEHLDFTYMGGLYRDVYLISTNPVHITDPNQVDEQAGGGVFFRTLAANAQQARVGAKIHISNTSDSSRDLIVRVQLVDSQGRNAGGYEKSVNLAAGASMHLDGEWDIPDPDLWEPDHPHLSKLHVQVLEQDKVLDAQTIRVGIRHFVMNDQGFILNGKPFSGKLIGANRHQDFAYVGNALPNIAHWRDAKKLRDAGLRVVRSAHYPQDPAFMDAADELGLFVIVATPGWQFWNKDPQFTRLVCRDIRQMIRRDRNHPSVWVWEPILNETSYPPEFAKQAYEVTHQEFPWPSCYAGCDSQARGAEHYDLIYSHPLEGAVPPSLQGKPFFTREFGDNVDDWSSHNSPSRASRKWGEIPMLIQANHYIDPPYPYTSWETLYKTPAYHIGGALWHSFDHQRGYHPDPFYGGIMDSFRQPKTSWFAFKSQQPLSPGDSDIASGPFVYIAHEMTPFSPHDVTVYTNCDSVRLTAPGQQPVVLNARQEKTQRPGSTVIFSNAFDFMKVKARSRSGKPSQILAEGLVDGKVVATHVRKPAKRPSRITLTLDNEGIPMQANGSDMVVVIASITDSEGNVKRLNNEVIQFTIEGEGEIIGDATIGANPRIVSWGTAPVLVRSTTKAGTIKLTAQVRNPGKHKPQPCTLEWQTIPNRARSL